MKKLILFCFVAILGKYSNSQTAVDFTAPDCSGASHNLFTQLNAGKIIVFVWVMPCGTCISDAKAAYDAAQSFSTSNPGRVLYWLSDDVGNSSCVTINSWASTNAIGPSNLTVFGNTGNVIDENNYGGSAMPHVLVLGGGNHKVYYNKRNGSNDGVAITAAINQAITTGINKNVVSFNRIILFPNPARDKITLNAIDGSVAINSIEIFNILGEKVLCIKKEDILINGANIEINLPLNLIKGNYIIKLKNDEEYQSLRFTIVE